MSDKTMPLPDLLYGVKAIAEHLGLDEKTARHRVDRKVIPTFKMGGTVCARRSTLDGWLADLERTGAGGDHDGVDDEAGDE